MASILELMGNVQQQGELGRQRGTQSRLADLASQAYSATPEQRQGILSDAFRTDASGGMQLANFFQKQEDDSLESLGREALMFAQTAQSNQDVTAIGPMYARLSQRANRLGLNVPETYDPKVLPMIEKFGQTYGMGTGAQPSGYNEFQLTTRAAGLQPGTPEYQEAAKVRLGVSGRASSGGFGFDKVKGTDGRERLVRQNPRTGIVEVYDETTGDFAPFGDAQPMGSSAPMPQGGDPFASLHAAVPGLRVTSQMRTPEENARLPNSVPNSYHLSGQAIDIGQPTPEQRVKINQWAAQNDYEVIENYQDGHVHLEPRSRRNTARPGLGTSRTPEEEAYAKKLAEDRASIESYRRMTELEAERAGATAGAKADAETAAKRTAEAPQRAERMRQMESAVGAISDAITSAKTMIGNTTTGALGAGMRNVPGSRAYDLAATLETVKANLGFDRLQQMREASPTGGALGAVAVQELTALQSSLANLDPNQSPAQLKRNLESIEKHYAGWLRAVRQANMQGAGQENSSAARPVTQADFDRLPAGSLYVDPDDGRTYRKD